MLAFGNPQARLAVVGLAPGKHGANRTGRPFTGDFAGLLLYETLEKFGLTTPWVLNEPINELDVSEFPPWFARGSETEGS